MDFEFSSGRKLSDKELARRPIRSHMPVYKHPEHPLHREKESENVNTSDEEDEDEDSLSKEETVVTKKLYPDLSSDDDNSHQWRKTEVDNKPITPPNTTRYIESNTIIRKSEQVNGAGFTEYPIKWLMVVLVLICAILVVMCNVSFSPTQDKKLDAAKIIDALKKNFVQQTALNLRIIKKSINKVIDTTISEPTQPSILLLLSSRGTEEVGNCFAVQLATLITKSKDNFLEINGETLKDGEPDRVKKEIDHNITQAFEVNGQSVVLLRHFDLVPASAAMMLHSYCDHENAPFKKAIFIMTIASEKDIPENADTRLVDSLAANHLMGVWNSLHPDQLAAFLARITVSVVAILPDKLPSKCRLV